jgi:hypothetical protein
LVVRIDSGLGLDFIVHASVYGKVPPPQELVVVVVVVDVVLHDPTPSQNEKYVQRKSLFPATKKTKARWEG